MIFLLLLVGAKGLLLNPNHTHRASTEERLDLLEKQLADEKRQRYMLQIENEQEKETIAQLKHQLDTMNDTDQKRFKDISTQIRGALLSINTLETNFGADNQNLVDALKAVETNVANLTLNQSESQRHLQEKENTLSIMIDEIRYNQSMDQEEVTHLKASVTSLDNKQRTLESTVNANVNKQNNLQSQITKITDLVVFLSIQRTSFSIIPVAIDAVFHFPVVKISVGGGYDKHTGVFTCPSTGYYVFHWTLRSFNKDHSCSTEIIKNNVFQMSGTDGGNLATFHMNRNDKVWIKSISSSCISFGHLSSFSGFKLM